MSIFKNGRLYHYEFVVDGRRYRGSTGTANKPEAIAEERRQRAELLEKSYSHGFSRRRLANSNARRSSRPRTSSSKTTARSTGRLPTRSTPWAT